MEISESFTLSVEDIRYLRHTQLSLLTGIDASNFSAWDNRRRISERSLERIAQCLRMSKIELLQSFDLRRQDVAIARSAQAKADQLIARLGLDKKTA